MVSDIPAGDGKIANLLLQCIPKRLSCPTVANSDILRGNAYCTCLRKKDNIKESMKRKEKSREKNKKINKRKRGDEEIGRNTGTREGGNRNM